MNDVKVRVKPVLETKKNLVKEIAEKIKNSRTTLIASIKSLPASQFQKMKKNLRGKAEIVVAKKSIINRAIGTVEKGAVQNLKKEITADVALIFSGVEAFELAALLVDNQTPAKAKVGDVAPEDIKIEPGPTELMPGPAISELGAVGLKVAVEGGKLAIKQGATLVKAGEKINEKVVSVLGKLKIEPMKVGFIPVAAYDSRDDSIYTEIKIDKEGALQELRNAISKAIGFAVNVSYVVKETVSYFISKAAAEEKVLERIIEKKEEKSSDDKNDKEEA